MTVQTVLPGMYVSADTAYVVEDYPYGFRLRCKIRYWLEVHPRLGVRMMSQTTNPQKPGIVWNKPKGSTYAYVAAAMYLDENGHVQQAALSEYTDAAESEAFRDQFADGVPDPARAKLDAWCTAKRIYEARRDAAKEAAQ